MAETRSVVVVGAGIAGLATSENLRARGFVGTITLVGEESHLPYNRPPLSKQLLIDGWSPERLLLADAGRLDSLGITYLPGVKATGLDVASRRVRLGAEWVGYGALVIATGLSPRQVPGIPGEEHVRVLRTLDDGIGLADALRRAERVMVLGGGILACELASATRKLGLPTTLVARHTEVGPRSLGSAVTERTHRLLLDHDVQFLTGRELASVGRTSTVLSDGTRVDADVVVAAIGAVPNTSWLARSGLDVEDGILCDHRGMASPDVYAVGDVARWRSPVTGIARRLESQSSAIDQAEIVAGAVLGDPMPQRSYPLFWTELFGNRITAIGECVAAESVVAIAGDLDADRFVAEYTVSGRRTGLVGWNMPREFRQARTLALTEQTKGTVAA
ncbi:FAD-dependent oxidoreductase [Arthrobacter sp. M4]|uniref:NAD(P)/FAD-dependent oxidoreductase n=1 Tax=Arthrobacter sp. M4 TaxID=218160 RepID=UPI001CDBECE3|nr:FAD-dependent oxidoreductase [Arthrobacter sp. M4]MCA4132585.1 FAD-dependent oxidoreductase [Arthrobacter sp. M4]